MSSLLGFARAEVRVTRSSRETSATPAEVGGIDAPTSGDDAPVASDDDVLSAPGDGVPLAPGADVPPDPDNDAPTAPADDVPLALGEDAPSVDIFSSFYRFISRILARTSTQQLCWSSLPRCRNQLGRESRCKSMTSRA